MKDANKTKQALIDLKRELTNLTYCIHSIKVVKEDRRSLKSLSDAKAYLANIERIMKRDISELEKNVQSNIEENSYAKFKQRLGTINSPSLIMRKNAEDFMRSHESPSQLIKKAILEQIKKASTNGQSKKKGSI